MHGKVVVIEPIVFFFLVADISEFLQFRKEEVKCPYKITNERRCRLKQRRAETIFFFDVYGQIMI